MYESYGAEKFLDHINNGFYHFNSDYMRVC